MQGVDHVAFGVADQEGAIAWYQDVLGLHEEHQEWGRHPAMLAEGGSGVALFDAAAGLEEGFLHLAFRVDRASFDAAVTGLAARGIDHDVADHGSAHSVYFRGPGGVRLELTTYEVG